MRAEGRGSALDPATPILVRLDRSASGYGGEPRHPDCPESFVYDDLQKVITRTIRLGAGSAADSSLPVSIVGNDKAPSQSTLAATYDYAWLRLAAPPSTIVGGSPIRCVDLFSGLGGMSLGIEEAARALGRPFELVWAADSYDHARTALALHQHPLKGILKHPIEGLLNGELGSPLTWRERALKAAIGPVDFLVGGPPCQGHSNLNNHTRRSDPKNQLYLRMVRAAEVLRPSHVIIENVPGVEKDDGKVLDLAMAHLSDRQRFDYYVDVEVIRAELLGVAQTRHRMFLVASTNRTVDLAQAVEHMKVPSRSFEWACADLSAAEGNGFDSPARLQPETQRRIQWLYEKPGRFNLPNSMRPECHQKPHRYTPVYGRMWQNQPAGTITTGFLVMGQGRFVHPHEPRTLTPHEGARLQFIPDWVTVPHRFRKDYSTLIGNAVPPKVAYCVALALVGLGS